MVLWSRTRLFGSEVSVADVKQGLSVPVRNVTGKISFSAISRFRGDKYGFLLIVHVGQLPVAF